METIPSNSIVAILSTLFLLGNSRAASIDGQANDDNKKINADDIFVAYEHLRVVSSASRLSKGVKRAPSDAQKARRNAQVFTNGGVTDGTGWAIDMLERGGTNDSASWASGLVVTASLPHSTATGERRRRNPLESCEECNELGSVARALGDCPTGVGMRREENLQHGVPFGETTGKTDAGETTRAGIAPRSSAPLPPSIPLHNVSLPLRLSEMAPLPLVVFDVDTFSVLGELDEGFLFQGGIADWVRRAQRWEGGAKDGASRMHKCSLSMSRPRRCPQFQEDRYTECNISTDGIVLHVHEPEWGNRYVHPWPIWRGNDKRGVSRGKGEAGDGARNAYAILSETMQGAPSAGYENPTSPKDWERLNGNSGDPEGARGWRGDSSRVGQDTFTRIAEDDMNIDQWSRLPPAELEKLVQADADLFFLPWLLASPSKGE